MVLNLVVFKNLELYSFYFDGIAIHSTLPYSVGLHYRTAHYHTRYLGRTHLTKRKTHKELYSCTYLGTSMHGTYM